MQLESPLNSKMQTTLSESMYSDLCLPSVLIIADNASAKFGGEAVLPLHYFRELRRRGVEVWLITHARVREELTNELGDDVARVVFIEDSALHRFLWRTSAILPGSLRDPFSQLTLGLATQYAARRLGRVLVRKHHISVVHQPTPVSPKAVSMLFAMGAPVVIGPMNGGMSYPPAFRRAFESPLTSIAIAVGRSASSIANLLVPGKALAFSLLVANNRTRDALPRLRLGSVVTLVENGVGGTPLICDGTHANQESEQIQLIFVGRLTKWKGVHLLLPAFASLQNLYEKATIHIVGDGEEMASLRDLAARLGIADRVKFHGFLPNQESLRLMASSTALVLPSLYECGGAVVLEAMLQRVPVIATNWGGPADYLDETCGILVDPTSPKEFEESLFQAMSRLAESPQLCQEMGSRGQQKVLREYTWSKKIDDILNIYRTAIAGLGESTKGKMS